MKNQPIRIPAPHTPSRFAVPLIKEGNERDAMEDYAAYGQLLERWGFKRVLSARSFSHHAIIQQHSRDRPEQYDVWIHPAGVYARTHSYSHEAYTGIWGRVHPAAVKLGSIILDTKIDLGMGGELQHRAAGNISGSGGTDPQLDGGSIRSLSETLHSNTRGSLFEFFKSIQTYGKILPFDRWHEGNHTSWISLPAEVVVPIEQVGPGQGMEQLLAGLDLEALVNKALTAIPQTLRPLLNVDDHIKPLPKKEAGQRRGPGWDPVEFSIDAFSEAMFLAGKRWPKPQERELLAHWNRVARGDLGEALDPEAMRAFEAGPAGLSLATALLYTKRSVPGAAGLLEQLLEQAPEAVLRRWASEPDGAGYTLALRVVARAFVERILDTHEPLDVDVLGILHRRLGPAGIVLATPTRSLMGMALQTRPRGSMGERGMTKAQEEFSQMVTRLEDWGLPWHMHARWRTYPNIFKPEEEGKPAFYQVDGPVDGAQWQALLGDRMSPALAPVVARLECATLELSTPPVQQAPTRKSGVRL